jgi:hypothetical protein
MKKVLLSVAVVAFAMSFTSCKKCKDCSFLSSTSVEYCGDELKVVESAGYDCK